MTIPISFSDSNHNIQVFLIVYFKFLDEYCLKENNIVRCFKKGNSLSESFALVRNIILYYQSRNLLIDDINIHNDIIIENRHNIYEFPIALSLEDQCLYKNIELISDRLLYKLFPTINYVVCTENSKPSKLWINEKVIQTSFYDN